MLLVLSACYNEYYVVCLDDFPCRGCRWSERQNYPHSCASSGSFTAPGGSSGEGSHEQPGLRHLFSEMDKNAGDVVLQVRELVS
jgi:hypothetical protein